MQAVSSSHTQSVRYRARGQASARDSTSDVFFDVAAAAATALTAAVAVPGARRLLHFGVPASGDLAMSLAAVTAAVVLGAAMNRQA